MTIIRKTNTQRYLLDKYLVLLLALISLAILGSYDRIWAQTETGIWREPINISRSGSATDPVMVVDSNGTIHIVWRDAFLGYVYAKRGGDDWSEPEDVSLPFEMKSLLLLADEEGFIHAFWLDETNSLMYSWVNAERFSDSTSWSRSQRLAVSALAFDVVVDSDSRIHLSYVRELDSLEAPSGIYYRRLSNRGGNWSTALSFYQSPYFRGLDTGDASVKISATSMQEKNLIFVVWDNRPRERVYLIRSTDGGSTWSEVEEVDRLAEGTTASGPQDIKVIAHQNQALLLWKSGQTEARCLQYFRWSDDGGETWGQPQRMLEDIVGCSRNDQLFIDDSGNLLLMATINDQSYLLAWDGSRWSNPQNQRNLTGFIDSDTLRLINFTCHQMRLTSNKRLAVVGCEIGGEGDIWFTERLLVDLQDWFPQDLVWKNIASLRIGRNELLTPVLASDDRGYTHAIWSHPSEINAVGQSTVLSYIRFDGIQWTEGLEILKSPDGMAIQPAIAVDPGGRLLVVWSGGETGQILFSDASIELGLISASWSDPQQLPTIRSAGSNPDILVDQDGTIYVIYAIPINEHRGIYLVRSLDGGITWSEPIPVFDGVAAGWEIVDNPQVVIVGDNQLHAAWLRYPLPYNAVPSAYYSARSLDGGRSWSEPELVVEGEIVWSELITGAEGSVHRVWQERSADRMTIWHELSLDGGVSWERISPVSIFGDAIGDPDITADPGGRLHLLQLIQRDTGQYALQDWQWDSDGWSSQPWISFNTPGLVSVRALNSVVSSSGELVVVFTLETENIATGDRQYSVYYTARALDNLDRLQDQETTETTTGAPLSIPTTDIVREPEQTPTLAQLPNELATPTITSQSVAITPQPVDDVESVTRDPWIAIIAGPIAASLVVLLVFIFSWRGVWLNRKK